MVVNRQTDLSTRDRLASRLSQFLTNTTGLVWLLTWQSW